MILMNYKNNIRLKNNIGVIQLVRLRPRGERERLKEAYRRGEGV